MTPHRAFPITTALGTAAFVGMLAFVVAMVWRAPLIPTWCALVVTAAGAVVAVWCTVVNARGVRQIDLAFPEPHRCLWAKARQGGCRASPAD